jgi:nucleotide-binding universal stress UspA family protein
MTTILHHRPERIAVGVDGSVASHAAVRWALDHARSGDTVTLVHVLQPSPITIETGLVDSSDDSGARSFVDRELARIDALPRDLEVTVNSKVIHGNTSDSLGAVTADLLVVGAGSHGRLIGAVLGSVSAHLVRHARVPLVIVPTPDASESATRQ